MLPGRGPSLPVPTSLGSQIRAPGDENHLTLDHRGGRAREEFDQAAVIIIRDIAPTRIGSRRLGHDLIRLFTIDLAQRRGIDGTRRDAIGANAERCQFLCQIAHQTFRKRLADTDGGIIWHDDPATPA